MINDNGRETLTKTDTTTGFPEVPEGYFWQIKHAHTNGAFRLELRKKLFWIFSERVEWTVIWPPLTRSSVFTESLYVLDKWDEYKERMELEYASSVYIGKYPPKNLKDAP